MAIIRIKDMRKLSMKEMDEKIKELNLELAKEKGNIAIGASVSSPGRLKEIKKTIARLKTIKKEYNTKKGGK